MKAKDLMCVCDVCMYAGSVKYTYKTILYMHNITYNVMDCTVNPEIFV